MEQAIAKAVITRKMSPGKLRDRNERAIRLSQIPLHALSVQVPESPSST
jgi:hypothetical protein